MEPAVGNSWFSCPPQAPQGRRTGLAPKMTIGGAIGFCFAVAGLSIDKDPGFVREFLREVGVSYVNYIDTTQAVAGPVAGIESLPQTLVFGPDGRLRQTIEGYHDWDDPQTLAQLEARQ